MYEYNATLVRVIDGDTVVLDFDLGLSTHRHASVRLAGIDAVERRDDPRGLAILAVAGWFARINNSVVVRTQKDKKSFDRYIATILPANFEKSGAPDLSTHMVNIGFAKYVDYS